MLPAVRRNRLMRRLEAKHRARIGRGGDDIAQNLDDLDRLLHQRGIARRELALVEIDVVFEAHAGMAAEQDRLRRVRRYPIWVDLSSKSKRRGKL
jgi:hypothetical protein